MFENYIPSYFCFDFFCKTLYLSIIGVIVFLYTFSNAKVVWFMGWLLANSFYKIKIIGKEHIPYKGPALLACNHVTYIDSLFICAAIPRTIRFIMLEKMFNLPIVNHFAKVFGAIPITPGDRASVDAALDLAVKAIKNGEIVCIFPEGKLTTDGHINEFKTGIEIIAQRADIPITPMHLNNAWGSIFSYEGGKVFWKRPKQFPYPIEISFGESLAAETPAEQVRQRILGLDLIADAVVAFS